jgi:hypothetical protein
MSSHTYHKTWDDDVVTKYITQESQEKSPEVFLETHLPITHIKAETLIGGNTGFITEQQLLEHVVQSTPDTGKNRIYMLKGEVGSGKSHLCQWLEYQLNGTGGSDPHDEEHVAIHISRNNTRLADILDKLYEHIDDEHDEVDDVTAYDDYPDVVDTLLSMLGTFDADLSFEDPDFDFETFIADASNGADLREFLVKNLQEYRDSVEAEEKEQRFELLTREQFGKICFNKFGQTFGGERGDDIYPDVRKAINSRLMVNIGIENFQEDLQEISQQYQDEGKRPVLICEDVTTFNVLKDDLLDHIFELGDGSDDDHGFDIVLGYTTGWEDEKADDALTTGDLSFMVQRAQGYLTMTDQNGQAFFLKQGSMPVRLVRQYLEVIKEKSEVNVTADIDDEAFDGMYPFSERFIVRAYRHLQEKGDTQRTPRLLLYHVVGDALRSGVPPFLRTADNTHLGDFAVPMSVQNLTPDFQRIAKWYGRMDGDSVIVPEAVCTAFGVSLPDELTVEDGEVRLEAMYSQAGWEVTEEELEGEDPEEYVRRQNEPDASTGGEGGDDAGSPDGDGDDDDGDDEPESGDISGEGLGESGISLGGGGDDDDQQQENARRIGQFQDWIGTGGDFPSSTRLTEGVQAALNKFYDPTRLANENAATDGTAAFYYTSGKDVPVTIIGPDDRKSVSVDVHFKDDEEALYFDLFRYGLDDEFPPETNFDRIRGWSDERVLELRQHLRDDLEDCLPDDGLPSTFELEELLVLVQLFIHNARTGATTIDREEVLEVPDHAESSPFRGSKSKFNIPSGLDEGFTELNKRRTDVKKLCEGFFLLRSNFVDEERLGPALENVTENLDAYVDAAARISASDLAKAYRIGTSWNDANGSTTVRSFFRDLSDYANELQKLANGFDADTIEEDLSRVRSLYSYDHTASDLQKLYEKLEKSFGPLDTSLNGEWVTLGDDLQDGSLTLNLTAFGETLREFEEIDPDNGLEAISLMHTYNHSRQTQDAWDVYEAIAAMIQGIETHEDAEGSQFEDELKARTEFTTYQTKREKTIETLEAI